MWASERALRLAWTRAMQEAAITQSTTALAARSLVVSNLTFSEGQWRAAQPSAFEVAWHTGLAPRVSGQTHTAANGARLP